MASVPATSQHHGRRQEARTSNTDQDQHMPQQREVRFQSCGDSVFRVDIDGCTFGTVNGKGEYKERSNFSMELEQYVDGQDAGFFTWVRRKSDGQKR